MREFIQQRLKALLADDSIRPDDLTRLVALYALRYEKHAGNALPALVEGLKKRVGDTGSSGSAGGTSGAAAAVLAVEYGGAHARQSDLFGLQDAAKITKRLFKVVILFLLVMVSLQVIKNKLIYMRIVVA